MIGRLSVLTVMAGCAVLAQLAPANGQLTRQNTSGTKKTDASKRSLAALELAKQAAQNGLDDVSFEAVRRAVGSGPPVSTVALGSLLNRNPQPRSSSSNQVDEGPQLLAQKLLEVHGVWNEQQLDPNKCYQVWKQLIFPSERATEAFLYSAAVKDSGYSYSISLSMKEPPEVRCAAYPLLHWAAKAGEQKDLQDTLKERGKMPAAQATVEVLQIALAKDLDLNSQEELCKRLQNDVGRMLEGRDSDLLFHATYSLLNSMPVDSQARNELWDALVVQLPSVQRWAANDWLKFAILSETRKSLEKGDAERFDRYSQVALSIMDPLTGNEDYKSRTISSFFQSASKIAFDNEHLVIGLKCMGEATHLSSNSTGSGQKLFEIKTLKKLLKLPPEERYASFSKLVWSLPMLGLVEAASWAPTDKIPTRFKENYFNFRKTDQLPIEQITRLAKPDCQSLSLLEWVMRDAIALGKSAEIEENLERLKASGSDDYVLGAIIWDKARNQAIDLGMVSSKEGGLKLREEIDINRGPFLSLDSEIAELAILSDDPNVRQAGVDLAQRLEKRSLSNRTNEVSVARRLVSLAQLTSENPPARASALKHFVKADDFRATSMLQGTQPSSLWLEREAGVWEHKASAFRSSLLCKYPLQGDFEISFTATDGTYAESAATACGLYLDFRGYLKDVAVAPVGLRKELSLKAPMYESQGTYAIRLQRNSAAGTLNLFCDDQKIGQLAVAEQEFPFFGAQSMYHRQMALRDFKITGDVTIPRQIDLLTPQLLGWSNLFRSRRLPSVGELDASKLTKAENQSEKTSPEKSKASSEQTEAESKPKSVLVNYDWELEGGELTSVDHKRLHQQDKANGLDTKKRWQFPHEEWLYYTRPLADGETVTYEFYHSSGEFSLWPTLDRIAIQLNADSLREHWITSDAEALGVSATNRRDILDERKLGEIQLKQKAWNSIALKRTGDRIRLTLNETPIYEHPIDPVYGGRFGFLQDHENFQVKIRNVKLTGDWPKELPDDLFEKRE